MLKHFFYILTLIFSFQTIAETGFKLGSTFNQESMTGNVTLYCRSGSQYKTVHRQCYDYRLSPSNYSSFIFEGTTEADRVTLSVTKSNGKRVSKTYKFDNKKNESKKKFNLWISTLTQRPFLELGDNEIHYSLTKKRVELKSGSFNVLVKNSKSLNCQHRVLFSSVMNDCNYYGYACMMYFTYNNNCQ
jgi:hypothetical protein